MKIIFSYEVLESTLCCEFFIAKLNKLSFISDTRVFLVIEIAGFSGLMHSSYISFNPISPLLVSTVNNLFPKLQNYRFFNYIYFILARTFIKPKFEPLPPKINSPTTPPKNSKINKPFSHPGQSSSAAQRGTQSSHIARCCWCCSSLSSSRGYYTLWTTER